MIPLQIILKAAELLSHRLDGYAEQQIEAELRAAALDKAHDEETRAYCETILTQYEAQWSLPSIPGKDGKPYDERGCDSSSEYWIKDGKAPPLE